MPFITAAAKISDAWAESVGWGWGGRWQPLISPVSSGQVSLTSVSAQAFLGGVPRQGHCWKDETESQGIETTLTT